MWRKLINALNNSGIQFMVPSILIVISVAINLHQVSILFFVLYDNKRKFVIIKIFR